MYDMVPEHLHGASIIPFLNASLTVVHVWLRVFMDAFSESLVESEGGNINVIFSDQ
jgi:hypothetical protein